MNTDAISVNSDLCPAHAAHICSDHVDAMYYNGCYIDHAQCQVATCHKIFDLTDGDECGPAKTQEGGAYCDSCMEWFCNDHLSSKAERHCVGCAEFNTVQEAAA